MIDASSELVWSLVVVPGFWVADEAGEPGATAVEGESVPVKSPAPGDVWDRRPATIKRIAEAAERDTR
ncbi:hypothetical protein LZG04_20300 [Saccharothrix sp. S26]|uniref:hypothetical protein n=1 Tax=Saccharothrix sp. S26 TaxID=2907215 RepID=UPI001F2CF1C0|nr:hypothetical protein [Saccharothrix sp. S26]MCE6997125.1 hypothetical protein [Saccharothrix sp. S26]